MDPFKSKGKCRIIVLIEMTLSGLTLTLFILFLVGMMLHLSQDSSFLDLLEERTKPVDEVIIFVLRMVVLTHLLVLILVLGAGQYILSKACSITPYDADLEQLNAGVSACKLFCRLEAFRMVLIVVTFMGELSLFNLSIILELIRNVFNVPVIFGWFFASELQKELESRKAEVVANSRNLYTLSDNGFPACQTENQSSSQQYADIPRESHHLDMFMNTSPADLLSNSHPHIARLSTY